MLRKPSIIVLSLIFLIAGATAWGSAKKGEKKPAHGPQVKSEHKKAPGGERENVHWSYEGRGAPEHWGYLESNFTQCRKGDM